MCLDPGSPIPVAPPSAGARTRQPGPATVNPNHHLWRNGRLWWIAVTVLHDGWRQERIRRSLGTADLLEARRRRDDLLTRIADESDVALSGLTGRVTVQ